VFDAPMPQMDTVLEAWTVALRDTDMCLPQLVETDQRAPLREANASGKLLARSSCARNVV